jgi:Calx-beta domain/Divergent InlB B-repeat domain
MRVLGSFHIRTALPQWLLVGLVFGLSALPAQAQNTLYLNSQSGDYIGGGEKVTYTDVDGSFSSSVRNHGVQIAFSTPGFSHWWHADLTGPVGPYGPYGRRLGVGSYESAERFRSATHPGLDISGEGRGCNEVTGRFIVLEATYDGQGELLTFAADFEQHCEGGAAALYGAVRIDSAIPIVPVLSMGDAFAIEGGVMTFTVALSEPASSPVTVHFETGDGTAFSGTQYVAATGDITFTPPQTRKEIEVTTLNDGVTAKDKYFYARISGAAGIPLAFAQAEGTIYDGGGAVTYMILDSSPGDYVGGGRWQKITRQDGAFLLERASHVQVQFSGTRAWVWDLNFWAPGGLGVPPGVYEGATRYPFNPPSQPGLAANGEGHGCGVLTGRFDVFESSSTSFAAEFEQYCEDWMPPLYGAVRYNSLVPLSTHALSVSRTGGGSGTVSSSPAGINCGAQCSATYDFGTRVTLTAQPSAGSLFEAWGGDCAGNGTCIVSLARSRSVSAGFVRPTPTPTPTSTPRTTPTARPSPTAPGGVHFYTLAPCRAVDTRAGQALDGRTGGIFSLGGLCGVPPTAKAASVNVTVTQPTTPGNLRLYAAGSPLPPTSVINFVKGQTRANNAIVALGPSAEVAIYDDQPAGATVHVIVDVNGYFQ